MIEFIRWNDQKLLVATADSAEQTLRQKSTTDECESVKKAAVLRRGRGKAAQERTGRAAKEGTGRAAKEGKHGRALF